MGGLAASGGVSKIALRRTCAHWWSDEIGKETYWPVASQTFNKEGETY